jgi:aromatic-L-amino-acid decarboxylase
LLLRLQESGVAVVSSTVLNEKFALRVAITNHRSRRDDFEILVQAVSGIGAEMAEDYCS